MNGSSSNSLRLLLNIFAGFEARDKNESSPPQVSRPDNVPLAVAQMCTRDTAHVVPIRPSDWLVIQGFERGFHRRAVLWAAAMTAAFEPVLKVEITCAKKITVFF